MIYVILIFLILFAIFLLQGQEAKQKKEIIDSRKLEEKKEKEIVKYSKNELLFKQYQKFISELFVSNQHYTREELIRELSLKSPNQSTNYYDEVFSDLLKAGLIDYGFDHIKGFSEYHKDLFFLGNAFYNLVFRFPNLIGFLRSKADYESTQISYELHDKFEIRSGSVKSKIQSNPEVFFYFGVTLGNELKKEINSFDLDILPDRFYLYTKPLKCHYLLSEDLKTTQYQQIFDKWFNETKNNKIH